MNSQKKLRKLQGDYTFNYISIKTLLETFNSLVKPILLFSSEIWGYESKQESSEVEKLFKILSGSLTELQKKISNGRGSSWIKKIEQLIAEYNLDISTYKYGSKNENFHHQLLSHNSLRVVLRKKLQTSFVEEWDVNTTSTSKLSFYRQYKQNHKLENYIVLVNNRRHKSALAKLRCSAHRFKIEIGRYGRFYSEQTKRHEQQLPREKRTCDTCKDKVEGEHHFLLKCSLNGEIHNNFFRKLYKIITRYPVVE